MTAVCSLAMIKRIRVVIFDMGTEHILRRMCRWTPVRGCIALTIVAVAIKHGTALHRYFDGIKCLELYFLFLVLPAMYHILHAIAKKGRTL
jgi:hypothetical protein